MIAIVLVGEEEERTPIKVVVPGALTDQVEEEVGRTEVRIYEGLHSHTTHTQNTQDQPLFYFLDQGPAPRRYEGDPDERGPPRRDDDKPRRRYIRDSADS